MLVFDESDEEKTGNNDRRPIPKWSMIGAASLLRQILEHSGVHYPTFEEKQAYDERFHKTEKTTIPGRKK